MKTVYLVRHGESVGNSEDVFKHPDAELTEKGHREAKELAVRCCSLDVEVVVSSPNKRAVQTAEHIVQTCNISAEIKPYFATLKYASKMVGLSKTGPEAQEYLRVIQSLYNDSGARYEDAENFSDLVNRFTAGLTELATRKEKVILVVTHESVLKSLLLHILFAGGQTVEQHINTKKTITKFDHVGISEIIFQHDRWQLVGWNDRINFAE